MSVQNQINQFFNTHVKNVYFLIAAGLVLASVTQIVFYTKAHADFDNVIVRVDRLQINSPTTGMVCANPASASGTEAKVLVTFPTGYTVSTTTSNWAVDTTNHGWPTGAVAWPSIATATAAAGQVVTFPSGDLTAGTLYCFNWTNTAALTTGPSTSGSVLGHVETQDTGGTTIDQQDFTTALVTSDQLAVSASVPQSFSFSLDANTDSLGVLNTASVTSSPTPRTVTISTNAKAGWNVWAKDSATGLASTNANYTIGSTTPGTNSTLSAGTEGYNTGVVSNHTSGAGTITVAAPFVGGVSGKGGGLNANLQTVASSSGTAAGDTVTITNNVAISALTPAATDYTDTITIVGAGSF